MSFTLNNLKSEDLYKMKIKAEYNRFKINKGAANKFCSVQVEHYGIGIIVLSNLCS